jgi:peptidoglycan/LPS O-acetylase OafA/YrhL
MNIPSPGPGAFRLLLAAAVVVEHVSRLKVGLTAVMIFFMLSGYWVTLAYRSLQRTTDSPVRLFYLSRALRIFPLYIVVFALALAGYAALRLPVDPMIWTSVPILGVGTTHRDMINVTWSLDVELQFYLLLPLFLAIHALVVRQRAGRMAGWAAFWGLSAALFAIGAAAGFAYDARLVLFHIPMFFAGIAIAVAPIRSSRQAALASVGVFAALWTAGTLIPWTRPFFIFGSGDNTADGIAHMLVALALLPYVAFNVRGASGAVDRAAGDLTYAVYLVHYPLIVFGEHLLGRAFTHVDKVGYLVAVAAFSLALWWVVDRPSEAFRARFIGRFRRPVRKASRAVPA